MELEEELKVVGNNMRSLEIAEQEVIQQGHHHNADQAARRPQIFCSICAYSFGALAKGPRLSMASLHSQPMGFPVMCSTDIFADIQPMTYVAIVGRNVEEGLFETPV